MIDQPLMETAKTIKTYAHIKSRTVDELPTCVYRTVCTMYCTVRKLFKNNFSSVKQWKKPSNLNKASKLLH